MVCSGWFQTNLPLDRLILGIMDTTLKILIIEDLEEDVGLIERVLKEDMLSFKSIMVDNREQYIKELESFGPHVILSDHSLPQFNSIEALKILRDQGIDIPFILVTGTVSEEFAVRCLKLGAHDYVLKSNLARLPAALKNAMQQHASEMKRKRAEINLIRQNKKLRKINSELDNFVYSVSHNLRGPLLSVLGLVNLTQHEDKEGKFKIHFDRMIKSISQLQGTLKDILDYSKNSRGNVSNQKVNFSDLISDVLEGLEYMEDFKKVTIHKEIDQEVQFYSDPFRIRILFNNLVCNAIQYRNKQVHGTIHIKVVVDIKKAHIVVTDNGTGIEENVLPHIYDMFYRGTTASMGAGLGLYIAKEAVVKLKGKLSVRSEAGKYTTFDIILPNREKRRK